MENTLVYLGLLSCLWIGIFGIGSVRVSKDIAVLPTPNPLINADDRVDVVLNCTGSSSDLSFYIKNRVEWDYLAPNGEVYAITRSFYKAPNSEFAENHFGSGHFEFKYISSTDSYDFPLKIFGVTHADNGVYRCTLVGEGNKIMDSKNTSLTVLHPVDRLSIEVMNDKMETIAEKKMPIMKNEKPVELTPGKYFVKCDASGSNPAPDMSLFFNENRPSIAVSKSMDTSGNRVRNTGTFTKELQLSARTLQQTVVCRANIPGDHFPQKEAGIALMVQVDKPDIKCSNDTIRVGQLYAKVICNVSAEGESNAGLVCEKVSWLLGNENQRIEYDQRWKDPSKKFDIMESSCLGGENGLQVTLTIFDVKPSHFAEMYFIAYGLGDNSYRVPFQLHEDFTAGVAMVTASLSTFLCLVMAAVAKHLML